MPHTSSNQTWIMTTVCPFLSNLHPCRLPFGPCFQLHPVQPPWSDNCEIPWTRMSKTHEQVFPLDHLVQILPFLEYIQAIQSSQINEEQFVLARAKRSGGNGSFPMVFPLHCRLLLLCTCLKWRYFLKLHMWTVITQSGVRVSDWTRVISHFISWALAVASKNDTSAYPPPHLLALETISNCRQASNCQA